MVLLIIYKLTQKAYFQILLHSQPLHTLSSDYSMYVRCTCVGQSCLSTWPHVQTHCTHVYPHDHMFTRAAHMFTHMTTCSRALHTCLPKWPHVHTHCTHVSSVRHNISLKPTNILQSMIFLQINNQSCTNIVKLLLTCLSPVYDQVVE